MKPASELGFPKANCWAQKLRATVGPKREEENGPGACVPTDGLMPILPIA